MDKQPVGQLPDLKQSNNDDEIMVITNDEYNQLKKEKISDLITDFTSTNENNALTKGTDGKMFVTDFGNASNITEGTLPTSVLPEIPLEKIPDIPKNKLPEIETDDLPDSGITAGTYTYPTDIVVNAQGQVTSITEGQPGANNANQDLSNLSAAGEKHFLNKTQITNCILEAPNGVTTYSGSTVSIKNGLKVLLSNRFNADGSLNNIEYTLPNDRTFTDTLLYNASLVVFISQSTFFATEWERYIEDTIENRPSASSLGAGTWVYRSTNENIFYVKRKDGSEWEEQNLAKVAEYTKNSSGITSFTPYQPVELLKRSDKAEITGWGFPSDYKEDISGQIFIGLSNVPLHTAPADGFLFWYVDEVPANVPLFINTYVSSASSSITQEDVIFSIKAEENYSKNTTVGFVPIAKGQKYCLAASSSNYGTNIWCQFIYAKGAIS